MLGPLPPAAVRLPDRHCASAKHQVKHLRSLCFLFLSGLAVAIYLKGALPRFRFAGCTLISQGKMRRTITPSTFTLSV